jgi:protein-S-isoprenylcysteine O-methyltransferase Ste14
MLYLLLFYILFFTAAMVVPTVRVWRSTGVNPLVMPRDDGVEGFTGRMFKLLILVLGSYLVLGSLGYLREGQAEFAALRMPVLRYLGWGLLAASLLWVVIAQVQMGSSWRVGIDSDVRTNLVSKGLFRYSRNPIFLGMMVQLIGLLLLLQNAFMLLIAVAAYLLISVQIRLEEAHLLRLHGDLYRAFCASVRHWL